jgi:hypothetical protein
MKTLFALALWCLLFVLCWPAALTVLVLWPLVWLRTSKATAGTTSPCGAGTTAAPATVSRAKERR